MAQTTTAFNSNSATLMIKVAAGSYVDISGSSASIDAAKASVMKSAKHTLESTYPLIFVGKENEVDVTVNVVYTETAATEAFMIVQAAYDARSAVQIKLTPRGAAAGANTIETKATGYITELNFPAVDAESADPLMASFVVTCPGITYTDVT